MSKKTGLGIEPCPHCETPLQYGIKSKIYFCKSCAYTLEEEPIRAGGCPDCGKFYNGMYCYACGGKGVSGRMSTVKQVTLPFTFRGEDGEDYHIVGWGNSKRLKIQCVALEGGKQIFGPPIYLSPRDTKELLQTLGMIPDQIPDPFGRRQKVKESVSTVEVTRKEWNQFRRFQETMKEVRELASENLNGWKAHLKYIQEEYDDYNEDNDDITEMMRALPRLLAYVASGDSPPDTMDDDDVQYYDDDDGFSGASRPRGREIVKVQITDISTGEL